MWLWLGLWACAPFSDTVGDPEASQPVSAAQICTEEPAEASCAHTFGGDYAHAACSGAYQCCDGAWGAQDSCGECACVEVTGEVGCAPEPIAAGPTCEHTYGGTYADLACSGGYQCCDGGWASREACGECLCVEVTGEVGCGTTGAEETCFDAFSHTAEPLPEDLRNAMTGTTWNPGCPVGLDALTLLTVPHWGMDGDVKQGRVVVRSDIVHVYVDAFQAAWESRFPIERMEPASTFGGSDDASMAVNNTSAFNCRSTTGGSSWSQHSYGDAIDINPRQNPYVSGSGNTVLPPEGTSYLDRDAADAGLLTESHPVVRAFDAHGWGWGGRWNSLKDYQHFSENGR